MTACVWRLRATARSLLARPIDIFGMRGRSEPSRPHEEREP